MITRLEVDGFKSLQGFAVDLEPFTVLIGPNGAGKSNILEALALLSRLASEPILAALKHGRGRASDQFSRVGGKVANEIRFAVEFLFFGEYEPGVGACANWHGRFRYELVIERTFRRSGAEHLSVRHELLRGLRPDEDSWMAAHPEFAELVKYGYSDKVLRKFVVSADQATVNPDVWPETFKIDRRRTFLADPLAAARSDFAGHNLRSCQWIRLDLAQLAGPSERLDTGALRPDGSNLPTVLVDLPASVLGEIRADVAALVPGVSSFFVTTEDDAFGVEFELSGGERVPARLISDGTLRLLALLTALRLEPRPYLIGIEEPENGIYPGRVRALIELLMRETERKLHEEPGVIADLEARIEQIVAQASIITNLLPTQILLTTHSPVILAALRKHPRNLRFVDTVHRDGHRVTRARAVGKPSAASRHLVISPREIDQILNSVTTEEGG